MATLALPLFAATSLLQFGQQRSAGKIAQMESETMAKQEELGVVQREADRKESLARAMASQTAAAGAKGISAFEGSPLSVLEADIAAEETATDRDAFMSKLSSLTTRAKGNIAKKQTTSGAFTGLINDFSMIPAVM